MYCPTCGALHEEKTIRCAACGETLRAVQTGDDTVARIIPYKNPPALIAYYLGVFSLIPFLGIVPGIAAFILGLIGLRAVRAKPESRGKVHAWIGSVLGGTCGVGYIILTFLIIKTCQP